MFSLHPRLAADTFHVCQLPLCELRLMNDSRFPWFILVPRVEGLKELHQLTPEQQQQLLEESGRVASALERLGSPDKINVAALGNLVPQFHWHLVARTTRDPCWPGPVWGCGSASPYSDSERQHWLSGMGQALSQ